MNIRTITINVGKNFRANDINTKWITDFKHQCQRDFKKSSIFIRTFRLNLCPIQLSTDFNVEQTFGYIEEMYKLCIKTNIRWFNIPFIITQNSNQQIFDLAYKCLTKFDNSFINFIINDDIKVNIDGIKACSNFIHKVSKLDNSGFNNFRVGVSCNAKADTPFFPFSYSSDDFNFTIGLEMAKQINALLHYSSQKSLVGIRDLIISKLSPRLKLINSICNKQSIKFNGMDLSLAPYPEKNGSVAELVESLSGDTFGGNGTLFITSYLTNIIKVLITTNQLKSVGFNGVMYSMLEDLVMGKRNRGQFTIDSLISYSTVCGCGLDMIPVPGNTFEDEISSMILDIYAISTRLKKPLGVRILPIPFKEENEMTDFCMDFLFNTRVMKVKNLSCTEHIHEKMFNYSVLEE